jgi:hypothetical protein
MIAKKHMLSCIAKRHFFWELVRLPGGQEQNFPLDF